MRKLLMLGIICALAGLVVPALAAQPEAPADGIQMNYGAKKEVVVTFNHSTHKDMACNTCHHPVNGVDDYRPCATAGCHDIVVENKEGEPKKIRYYDAMHVTKGNTHESCKSCHDKLAAALTDKAAKKAMNSCKKSNCHP